MPRNPQTEQERKETRAHILDAALRLFHAEGAAAISMRAVAAQAGMSAAAIYRYFPGKADLAAALWQEGLRGLEGRLGRIVTQESDPIEGLRAVAEAYADFAVNEPAMFRMLFLAEGGDDLEEVREKTRDFTSYYLARDCMGRAIEQGRIAPIDADLATQTLWAAIHGAISLRMTCVEFPFCEPRRLLAQVISTVLSGLQEVR